mmetsp:Transcript_27646/g.70440  ORF Transcript_27646/g.70440 Transcript_27646/m.70440 type:complete len:214 (+) Transcript_27646:2218-2859(+)
MVGRWGADQPPPRPSVSCSKAQFQWWVSTHSPSMHCSSSMNIRRWTGSKTMPVCAAVGGSDRASDGCAPRPSSPAPSVMDSWPTLTAISPGAGEAPPPSPRRATTEDSVISLKEGRRGRPRRCGAGLAPLDEPLNEYWRSTALWSTLRMPLVERRWSSRLPRITSSSSSSDCSPASLALECADSEDAVTERLIDPVVPKGVCSADGAVGESGP